MDKFNSMSSPNLLTKKGCFRYKYGMRSAFKAVALISLVAGFCVYNHFTQTYSEDEFIHVERHLQTTDAPSEAPSFAPTSNMNGIFQRRADPLWLLAPYIFGVLYMFLALAIICDEYFVPALEEMSGEHQLNMSMDIAGATLMAAGGSAPELFTSFIGTFQKSEVGFGTIVGSAVFNVLFVIGMCSMLSKDVLDLTWWPLFRDATYYAVSLVVLAVFVGVVGMKESSDCEETHPEEFLAGKCPKNAFIDLWEAIVLFAMYFGYVLVMKFNKQLYRMMTGKELVEKDEESNDGSFVSFKYHTTFRAGLLTLIRDPDSWLDKARVGFVSKIAGNVDEVFDFVDENGDGELSREEVQRCFNKLEDHPISESELTKIMDDLDTNNNGRVSLLYVLPFIDDTISFPHTFSSKPRSQNLSSELGIFTLRIISKNKSRRFSINTILTILVEFSHMSLRSF
jgi:sodium/potassium/calcium exchanger 2